MAKCLQNSRLQTLRALVRRLLRECLFIATVSQSQRVWTHVASMLTRHLVGATETQRFCVPEVPLELPSGGTLPRPGRRLQTTRILGSFSGGRQGHHLWALSLCSRPPRSPGLRLKARRTRKGLDRRAPWLRTASVVRAPTAI